MKQRPDCKYKYPTKSFIKINYVFWSLLRSNRKTERQQITVYHEVL